MKLTPLRGKVIVHNFKKGERMVGRIVLLDDDGKGHGVRPRWAQVLETASDITGVEKNQWVLIEHGRWSRSIKIQEEDTDEETEIWQIDYPAGVLCISDKEPDDNTVTSTDDTNFHKTI